MASILSVTRMAVSLIPCAAATSAIASDPWIGRYEGRQDSYHWQATIKGKGSGVYAVDASVASRMPACSGGVETTAKLVGGKLLITDEDCSLVISRYGGDGIKMVERQCTTSHGAACGFDAVLKRR